MKKSVFDDAVRYYRERYEEVVRFRLSGGCKKIHLRDHTDETSRRCRFCGLGKTDVTFRKRAHAAPEFLGNRDILSMNECDTCNDFLASNYEDHLAKWSLFARAASQVKTKKHKPTFKNPSETLRIETGPKGLEITLTDLKLTSDLMREGGRYGFTVPTDASSQYHVPIRAAMALVKIACSISRTEDREQCQPAIDWLMQRSQFSLSKFPVLYAFTPGRISDAATQVIMLRRRVEEPIPFLWFLVQFSNHRLQTFVPMCPADSGWLRKGETVNITVKHFPSVFGPNWRFGETEFRLFYWSGVNPVQTSAIATFHVEHGVRIDKKCKERRDDS
jgi:hypothetical protein